jgi:hypothetical protein
VFKLSVDPLVANLGLEFTDLVYYQLAEPLFLTDNTKSVLILADVPEHVEIDTSTNIIINTCKAPPKKNA